MEEFGSPRTQPPPSHQPDRSEDAIMSADRMLRLVAGFAIVASVPLAIWIHPGFSVITLLVGVNLLQSAFTNWCPLMTILDKGSLQG
jgi:type IV secretory pathway TrbD component